MNTNEHYQKCKKQKVKGKKQRKMQKVAHGCGCAARFWEHGQTLTNTRTYTDVLLTKVGLFNF